VNRGDAEQQAGQQRYTTIEDGLGNLVGKEDSPETEKKGRKSKRELGIREDLVPEEHDGVVDGHVAVRLPRHPADGKCSSGSVVVTEISSYQRL
jgi:hypothetical protein